MQRFRFGLAGLLSLLFCAAFAIDGAPAFAQSSADFIGRWTGATDWDGTKFDSSGGWWQFNSDGSFTDNNGETGSWSASGGAMQFQYGGGGHSVYSGRLIGENFIGTMTNGEIHGVFSFHRESGQQSAPSGAGVVGGWRFEFTDNTHEDWQFYNDGTATGPTGSDGAPQERGTWRMSGDRMDVEFRHVTSGAVASMSLTLRGGQLSGRYVSQTFQGDIVGTRH